MHLQIYYISLHLVMMIVVMPGMTAMHTVQSHDASERPQFPVDYRSLRR